MKTEWRDEDDLDDILDCNFELFPELIPEFCPELDDLDLGWPDARELRNHDCMWAGLCVSEKHERDSARHERVILPPTRRRVVAPTNSRSLLLPAPSRPPDRPDTPLSDNDLDLDLPELGDLLEDLPSVVPSEVTGQVASRVPHTPIPTQIAQPMPISHNAYSAPITDHCYFTTLPPERPVHTDSLGVQTPSDSEEEIDVETVGDGRKGLGPMAMPTAPTLQDRRELQRTVSAIVRRGRPALALNFDRRKRKRRLSSGGDYVGDSGRKTVKRKQYRRIQNKNKRRRRHMTRPTSSDSEMESTERRSLHNNLERQRRIDLRNAFEELRVLLPDTADNEKAAKVAILNSGAQFCNELELCERRLLMEKVALRKHQERLREEVSRLRRSLAMRR